MTVLRYASSAFSRSHLAKREIREDELRPLNARSTRRSAARSFAMPRKQRRPRAARSRMPRRPFERPALVRHDDEIRGSGEKSARLLDERAVARDENAPLRARRFPAALLELQRDLRRIGYRPNADPRLREPRARLLRNAVRIHVHRDDLVGAVLPRDLFDLRDGAENLEPVDDAMRHLGAVVEVADRAHRPRFLHVPGDELGQRRPFPR